MDVLVLLLVVSILGCIFGIAYLFFITRHRERMALIDKGENASLLNPSSKSISQTRRFTILNISLTLIGVGLGIAFAIMLFNVTGNDAVYPACIFAMSGLGLLVSIFINHKLESGNDVKIAL